MFILRFLIENSRFATCAASPPQLKRTAALGLYRFMKPLLAVSETGISAVIKPSDSIDSKSQPILLAKNSLQARASFLLLRDKETLENR